MSDHNKVTPTTETPDWRNDPLENTQIVRNSTPSKRQIKRAYLRGEIGLSEAIPALIFDHGMMRGEAFAYLEA